MAGENNMHTLLEESGLYGGGLVSVEKPLLVERYNQCLRAAGITPTDLQVFDIDGKGWSPQIAEEKKDLFYLSSGGAVQFAIILTPEQKGKPVYRPYYSFERYIMETIFERYSRAIVDLTSRSALWLQIDPGIARVCDPEDILLIESLTVTLADTAGVITAALGQRAMVKMFKEGEEWSNEDLRKKIIASASKFGDLRERDVIIPSIKISGNEMAYFYSEDFGGTFTLRNSSMKDSLLVVAKNLAEVSLISRLLDNKFVEIPLDWYQEHPDAIEDLEEGILVDAVYNTDAGDKIDFVSLTPMEKKRYAATLQNLPKEFFELEKFRKSLENGKEPKGLSDRLKILLMIPNRCLSYWAARVVWRLISRMTLVMGVPTISIADLYLYDKPTFFENFIRWPEQRKLWVIDHLKNRGLCPADSKGA